MAKKGAGASTSVNKHIRSKENDMSERAPRKSSSNTETYNEQLESRARALGFLSAREALQYALSYGMSLNGFLDLLEFFDEMRRRRATTRTSRGHSPATIRPPAPGSPADDEIAEFVRQVGEQLRVMIPFQEREVRVFTTEKRCLIVFPAFNEDDVPHPFLYNGDPDIMWDGLDIETGIF